MTEVGGEVLLSGDVRCLTVKTPNVVSFHHLIVIKQTLRYRWESGVLPLTFEPKFTSSAGKLTLADSIFRF